MKRSAGILLLSLTLCWAAGSAVQVRELTREEAIDLAEAAIVKNGCTDLTPLMNRPRLSADHPKVDFEFLMTHELDCHAIHAREGKVNGKPGWIIGFRIRHTYPEMRMDSIERLVLMNRDGSNLRLENQRKRIKRILKKNP